MVLINSPLVVYYSTSVDPIIVSVGSFEILDVFNDLELAQFKVIQGQKSWCQLEAH